MRMVKWFILIDLTSFLKSGDRSNFPKIKPNDTIVIKKTLTGVLIEGFKYFSNFHSFHYIFFPIIYYF